jgi:hypothetical protein
LVNTDIYFSVYPEHSAEHPVLVEQAVKMLPWFSTPQYALFVQSLSVASPSVRALLFTAEWKKYDFIHGLKDEELRELIALCVACRLKT